MHPPSLPYPHCAAVIFLPSPACPRTPSTAPSLPSTALHRPSSVLPLQAFDDCVSVYARFKLLDSFDTLLERPLVQDELERKHIALVHMVAGASA